MPKLVRKSAKAVVEGDVMGVSMTFKEAMEEHKRLKEEEYVLTEAIKELKNYSEVFKNSPEFLPDGRKNPKYLPIYLLEAHLQQVRNRINELENTSFN